MFERVTHADWVSVVPFVAFVCFTAAFAMIVIRALRIPRKEVDRLSRMPLEDDTNNPNARHELPR